MIKRNRHKSGPVKWHSTHVELPLTQGKYTLVNKADFDFLNQYNWHAVCDLKRSKKWYARGKKRQKDIQHNVRLHRVLLDCPRHLEVDHRNGNTLDNRRSNLRLCTSSENRKNRRPNHNRDVKGVRFDKGNGKWLAYITADYKTYQLGQFATKQLAIKAYNKAALKLHKEFARLN